jgi:hypothetical protein
MERVYLRDLGADGRMLQCTSNLEKAVVKVETRFDWLRIGLERSFFFGHLEWQDNIKTELQGSEVCFFSTL